MNPFGKLPQEQAIQTFIHDTNQELANLRHHTKSLGEYLRENGKQMHEAGLPVQSSPFIHIEYLKSTEKKLQEVIDVYIEKFKKDFQP